MEKLKPCPFCGRDVAKYDSFEINGFLGCFIECDKDLGGCGAGTDEYESPNDAVFAWNRRVVEIK